MGAADEEPVEACELAMSETVDRTRESLQDLVTSKGWLVFKEHARKEWGPEGYGRKVSQVIASNTGTLQLAPAVELIHRATEEINQLLRWPEDELKRLEPKPEHVPSMQRVPR